MQLDIFEHSRDIMLRSDAVGAIERLDALTARSAWQALHAEFPADACLHALDVLASALEQRTGAPFADHDAACAAAVVLRERVEPAALRMLGPRSGAAWLALQWRQLALRAAPLPFRADRSEAHSAPFHLCAGDWNAALAAVGGIESWRRVPAPLAWMAEARYRASGLPAAWPLLAELAWLSPGRFGALTRQLDDASLQSLRRKFDAGHEGNGDESDMAWLPAWALTEKPALAACLNDAQPSLGTAPEQALRLMLELLRLERQGRHHELVERRKALRSLNASLYGAYMKTR